MKCALCTFSIYSYICIYILVYAAKSERFTANLVQEVLSK